MATKVKLMKLLQEIRGFSEITRQSRLPKPSPLYLMQLRTHVAQTSQGKRKLTVAIDLKDISAIPHPVKITFVTPGHPSDVQAPLAKDAAQ